MFTPEQLIAQNAKLIQQRTAYANCVNEIDDFFEYAYKHCDSNEIQLQIHEYLNDLTDKLKEIDNANN